MKCLSICKDGKPCLRKAILGNYCNLHFTKNQEKGRKKKWL